MKYMLHSSVLIGVVVFTGLHTAIASNLPTNVMDFAVTNVSMSTVLNKVAEIYGISVCPEFCAGDFSSTQTNQLALDLRRLTCTAVLDAIVDQQPRYVWRYDATNGIINVYPRDESLLDWQTPLIDVQDLPMAVVLWGKVRNLEEWRKRNIFCEPISGNSIWTEMYHITLRVPPMTVRNVLNEICRRASDLSEGFYWWWELENGKMGPVFRLKQRRL